MFYFWRGCKRNLKLVSLGSKVFSIISYDSHQSLVLFVWFSCEKRLFFSAAKLTGKNPREANQSHDHSCGCYREVLGRKISLSDWVSSARLFSQPRASNNQRWASPETSIVGTYPPTPPLGLTLTLTFVFDFHKRLTRWSGWPRTSKKTSHHWIKTQ